MATPNKGGRKGEIRRSLSEEDDSFVYVFDRRKGDAPEVKIKTAGLFTFLDFKSRVQEDLEITRKEVFVIATTIREEIKDDASWDNIDNGDTLYILKTVDQELTAPAQERVNYLPHYDTIVKGGMYEYYASEGQNPIPYAFAELIDNALAATANNIGSREIEIRLYFDDSSKKNTVFIIDNGKGMTPRQLNNWAIYRLSKFNRRERRKFREGDVTTEMSFIADDTAPRSLNSDISYFGVGGKQATFYIGSATMMITKAHESKDVHELTISKDEFEKKEVNHEAIYSGFIRNRKPGDASHVSTEDDHLREIIKEESGKDSFTVVVVEGVNSEHVPYLKLKVKEWTRQLAHIYHYYIHGPDGNVDDPELRPASPFKNISITVKMYNSKTGELSRLVPLRDIQDDMQSLFVQNSAHNFEFKAVVEGMGIVEGVLRYHPFLYDKETYPSDTNDPRTEADVTEDHDYAFNDRPARGRRAIFECYWNGRLIPYTLIEEFDWCAPSKKAKTVPPECYNRISGVLWTNDRFQVSTNKLTFIDLEMKLRDKNTVFTRIIGGHERRTMIEKEFTAWLKECHEQHDKQVRFTAFKGKITRPELSRYKQGPWSVYEQIHWDNKVFKKGTLVRISRTTPMLFGTINRFMLFGDFQGEVFATGGDMEIVQEPTSLYNETRVFPLCRLDRLASSGLVQRYLDEEEAKLPDRLLVTWPEGMEVTANEKRPAGQTIGDIRVEIANKKGELMSKLPGSATGNMKKLLVELKIIWHSPHGDEEMVSHICQHGKTWPYWFRKMENIKNLGPHSIFIQAVLNESGATTFAGKLLPNHKIKFTVTEGVPDKFTVGLLEGPFRVAVPFQIPLDFQDEFNHPTKPTLDLKPVLTASGLELNYSGTQIKGSALLINGIVAKGQLSTISGKSFTLTVKVPGLDEDTTTMKIRLLPGPPSKLQVLPEDKTIEIENGNQVRFSVTVLDVMGNITTESKLNVLCKFQGHPGLPIYYIDCSGTGQGQLTGEPICLKTISEDTSITARIDLQGYKQVPVVERKVAILPSQRVADIRVFYDKDDQQVPIKNGSTISGVTGELIQNITFSVTDEAGKERQVDDKLVNFIKVNWTQRVNKSVLLQSKLSDIKIPTSTSESKFCQILFMDGSNLEFTFNVKGKAGEPSQLKCKCVGKSQGRAGEILDSDILVHIKDKYGNEITKFDGDPVTDFFVSGDGLNLEDIAITRGKACVFMVKSVAFTDAKIGQKEIVFRWKDLKDYLKVEISAGPPSDVTFPGWDLEQIITVYEEDKLPRPLAVQLLDKGGNPCAEPDIRILVGKDTGIKFNPALTPLRTDFQGKAVFGDLTVSGKTGIYDLQPKAFLSGKNVVLGRKLRISLQADPNRPVALSHEYEERESYDAGSELTEFSVRVLGEAGNIITSALHSHLTMKLWKNEASGQVNPPATATSFNPSQKTKVDKAGVFKFKFIKLPKIVGLHSLMFTYFDGKHEAYSSVIKINIIPNPPVKLSPLANPGTPTVSNTKSSTSRCLIRNLHLELRDKFENTCGDDINGTVVVEITSSDQSTDLPVFVGGNKKLEIQMTAGKAVLQNLYIQENTTGKDGEEYHMTCKLRTSDSALNKSIPSLVIPFLFYNDARKQSQMAALSKERDSLKTALKTYKSLFNTRDQLIMELKISVHDASQEEQRLKAELRKHGIPGSQLNSVESVDNLMSSRLKSISDMKNKPRRKCGLTPTATSTEVIGKICHLANVGDPDIARVLSWHMSGDMDCIVTTTTKKAKEIYHHTGSKQQVLPLDSIYRKSLPDWNKSLPHARFMPNWRPKGKPVYARSLLEFNQPERAEECKLVFGMLLGDSIILDTIEDATNYRQEVVKLTHCPTILTREGDRIRSNGKFGGLANRALPFEKLRGAVFGESLPSQYHSLIAQEELLEFYKAAMEKHHIAKQELDSQQSGKTAPEMKSKYQECKEVEQQLTDIENKLFGMSQSRISSPGSTPDGRGKTPLMPVHTPESPNKRARTSPRKSSITMSLSSSEIATNGSSPDLGGSRRQSKRLSTTTSPHLSDPRKKSRLS